MFDMENDQVVFIAKNKDWISIKKLLIDENAKQEDVSLILAQIQKASNEKSYLYAGIDTQKINEIVKKYVKVKRKNFATITQILTEIKSSELKKELICACKIEELYPLAENYFLNSILEQIGYSAYPNLDVLQKVYPHLKISKPRGNFGKKKK